MSESQNLKIDEGTTLPLFSQALVFVFERISALQSQPSTQCVEIWRHTGAIWIIGNQDGNSHLGGMVGGNKKKWQDVVLKKPTVVTRL